MMALHKTSRASSALWHSHTLSHSHRRTRTAPHTQTDTYMQTLTDSRTYIHNNKVCKSVQSHTYTHKCIHAQQMWESFCQGAELKYICQPGLLANTPLHFWPRTPTPHSLNSLSLSLSLSLSFSF